MKRPLLMEGLNLNVTTFAYIHGFRPETADLGPKPRFLKSSFKSETKDHLPRKVIPYI